MSLARPHRAGVRAECVLVLRFDAEQPSPSEKSCSATGAPALVQPHQKETGSWEADMLSPKSSSLFSAWCEGHPPGPFHGALPFLSVWNPSIQLQSQYQADATGPLAGKGSASTHIFHLLNDKRRAAGDERKGLPPLHLLLLSSWALQAGGTGGGDAKKRTTRLSDAEVFLWLMNGTSEVSSLAWCPTPASPVTVDYYSEEKHTSEETMNVLSNPLIRAQDQSLPLCGPGSVQDLPHCPPGFNLGSSLHPAPLLSLQGSQRSIKPQRELSPEEQQELRRKINSRERKRMQDLNIAMDALREVMVPYASSPSSASSHAHQPGAPPGRRLSKISTLVLARNYILLLGSSLQEMRRLLGEVSIGMGVNTGPVPRLMLAGGWPLISGPSQLLLTHESILTSAAASSSSPSSSSSTSSTAAAKCPLLSPGPMEPSLAPVQWSSTGASGGPLCPCGVCRLPRFSHSAAVPRFPK
ncbi:unnamed protein product [Pleuronectes platessa]|uniref:BHLH domain-containing protein n=2 Tax=Pleuronectes platessa TaxID=8262 RepID=A0A9N7TWL2_PLEPL|nr:unnamed protein product [Pleuronectes platessa]